MIMTTMANLMNVTITTVIKIDGENNDDDDDDDEDGDDDDDDVCPWWMTDVHVMCDTALRL